MLDNEDLSWKQMMEKWNKMNPEWQYSDRRNIHKDFVRVSGSLQSSVNRDVSEVSDEEE